MIDASLNWGSESARLFGAALAVLLYGAMCGAICKRSWNARNAARRAAAVLSPSVEGGKAWLVAYASQTGTAERLAWQTARALHAGGTAARIAPLSDVTLADLEAAERALFVVATYGEGDPPDNASAFASLMASGSASLHHLSFAVLALGDSEYQHFCGFGRSLDAWLLERNAKPLFDRIDADSASAGATAIALQRWQLDLERVGIESAAADFDGPPFEPWELVSRRRLNPGTVGGATFEIEIRAMHGEPSWLAGDLVQMLAPDDPDRARDYSIASLASEGSVKLLVRQERHPDGALGVASGWLTERAPLGAELAVRLRPNRHFQAEDNASRPMILIGNGTGLAGLRAHMRARAEAAQHGTAPGQWLLFGERQRAHDFYWQEDIEFWQRQGVLDRVDLAFSRDQPSRVYVQDLLSLHADVLRQWVDDDAAIYVCGSLDGMAGGVHRCLVDTLGQDRVDALSREGRYRRDVY